MIRHSELEEGPAGRRRLYQLIRHQLITWAGNRKLKIYGSLHCSSGKKMLRENRVFFPSENEALALGYRPCGHCMTDRYRQWKKMKMPMQSLLFNNDPISLLPENGSALLYPGFFPASDSDRYFTALLQAVNWRQEPIKIFGKEVMQPRLTAWYGDEGKSYRYSGITMQALSWIPPLPDIKQKIEAVAGEKFNSALLNLYRTGKDSMGWHRDNEKELGPAPLIGSVSFGATRIFQFRNYASKSGIRSVELTHGSLLLMRGETNHFWEHRVPKTNTEVKERINITFRVIY